jgi:hypothetical protein
MTFHKFRALALITVSPTRRIVAAADEQMVGHSVGRDVVGRRQCALLSMSRQDWPISDAQLRLWGSYERGTN